jgi:hypothetical protein
MFICILSVTQFYDKTTVCTGFDLENLKSETAESQIFRVDYSYSKR